MRLEPMILLDALRASLRSLLFPETRERQVRLSARRSFIDRSILVSSARETDGSRRAVASARYLQANGMKEETERRGRVEKREPGFV